MSDGGADLIEFCSGDAPCPHSYGSRRSVSPPPRDAKTPWCSNITEMRNPSHSYVDVGRVGHADLFGVDHVISFLSEHLLRVNRDEMDPVLVPLPQILMLYGRPGSGKRTCLHYVRDRETNQRLFLETQFAWVRHFRLREWDDGEFAQWCEDARETVRQMSVTRREEQHNVDQGHGWPRGPDSLLLVVGDLHYMSAWHSMQAKFALENLMQTIRDCSYNRRDDIRMVITCGESPSKFGDAFLSLVDRKCFMGLLSNEDRGALFIYWMHRFYTLRNSNPRLKALEWSIKLDAESIEEDPGHVVNTLITNSNGCTPREVYEFMTRTFTACSKPVDDGMTDYNSAFVIRMMYENEQNKRQIVPYNAHTMNSSILQYANLNPEVDLCNVNRFVLGSNEFRHADGEEKNDADSAPPAARESPTKKPRQQEDEQRDTGVVVVGQSNIQYRIRVSDAIQKASKQQEASLRDMHLKRKRNEERIRDPNHFE